MGLKEFFQNDEKKVNSYKPIKYVPDDLNTKNEKEVEIPSIQKKVPLKEEKTVEDKKSDTNIIVSSSTQKIVESIKEDKKEKGLISSFWSKEVKETVKRTLFLFLIEDTAEMVKHNDKVHMLYEMVPKEALVCFIHYGSDLYNSGVLINSQKVR